MCCCSVVKSWPTLCNPMVCSTPGSSVLHCFPEFAQIHAHWMGWDVGKHMGGKTKKTQSKRNNLIKIMTQDWDSIMKRDWDCSQGRQLLCLHQGSGNARGCGLFSQHPAQFRGSLTGSAAPKPKLGPAGKWESEGILWVSALFIKDKRG